MDEKKIWLCSDWHFAHNKSFLYEPRGFVNQWEMNEAIIANHNSVVGAEEEVYMLGDAVMSDTRAGIECIKRLKGHIHIICGNHDSAAKQELYKQCYNVVEVCDAKYFLYKKYHFFFSHYPCLCGNHDIDKPLKSRVINACGHSHVQDRFADWDKGLIYHVEMDAHSCFPILIDDIIADIKNKLNEKEGQNES